MKIKSIFKTAVLTSLLTTSCTNPRVYNKFHEAKPEKAVVMVLDSLASQGRALVDKSCRQFGKDTIMISEKEIKNPHLLTQKLHNLASRKNPYVIKSGYRSSCECLDNKKLFSQTHAVINSDKVFQKNKSGSYFVAVDYFGKK